MAHDFRVNKAMFSDMKFAVFGLGNSEYEDRFCKAAYDLQEYLERLSAVPLCKLGLGDDSSDMDASFRKWKLQLWPAVCEEYAKLYGKAAAENCGSCSSTLESSSFKQTQSWEEMEEGSETNRLPLNEYRRLKRVCYCCAANPVLMISLAKEGSKGKSRAHTKG